MPRFVLWIALPFLAAGLAMLAGAFFVEQSARKFEATAARASGVVVDLEYRRSSESGGSGTYAPVVEWTDPHGRAQRLVGETASNPPSYSRGERVNVLYEPWTPENARIDDFSNRSLAQLILGGMGAIFTALGAGLAWAVVASRRQAARLRASGVPIQATFLESYRDTGTTINGRHPYRVAAQGTHPATGRLCRFESDPIWVDPSATLTAKGVRVLVDPASEKDYLVDLSDCVALDDMV